MREHATTLAGRYGAGSGRAVRPQRLAAIAGPIGGSD